MVENGKLGNYSSDIVGASISRSASQTKSILNRLEDVELSKKRFFNILITIAVITVAALTFLEVRSTKALANQNVDTARSAA